MSDLHVFENILETSIKSANKVIIIPHMYPDFDVIQSVIGLSALVTVDDVTKVIEKFMINQKKFRKCERKTCIFIFKFIEIVSLTTTYKFYMI